MQWTASLLLEQLLLLLVEPGSSAPCLVHKTEDAKELRPFGILSNKHLRLNANAELKLQESNLPSCGEDFLLRLEQVHFLVGLLVNAMELL